MRPKPRWWRRFTGAPVMKVWKLLKHRSIPLELICQIPVGDQRKLFSFFVKLLYNLNLHHVWSCCVQFWGGLLHRPLTSPLARSGRLPFKDDDGEGSLVSGVHRWALASIYY
jgi:hypothetical protein